MAKIPDENVLVKIRYRKITLPNTYNFSEGDSLVLTMSARTSYGIALYTNEQWIAIMDGLLKAGLSAQRYLIGNAEDCIVEGGKIRISSHLMKAASLDREAMWIQRVNRVEICNPKFIETLTSPQHLKLTVK